MMRLGPEEMAIERSPAVRGENTRSKGGGSAILNPFPQAALTFDDGPDPVWTPLILNALSNADLCATFFVIAPLALAHPRIISSMLEDGHRVELHCVEHVRHTHRSRKDIHNDTDEALDMLRSLGVEPRLWRPPWGILAPWTEEIAAHFGLMLAPWSADTHDWRGDRADEMLRSVKPLLGPGCIVLMHDGLGPGSLRTGCEETVVLIDKLVEHLRSLGCQPAPLAPSTGGQV